MLSARVRVLARSGLAAAMLLAAGCASGDRYYLAPIAIAADLDAVDADLRGVALGWEQVEGVPVFLELRASSDASEDLELVELLFGGRRVLAGSERVQLRGQMDVGVSRADLSGALNRNTLLSVGVAARVEYQLAAAARIFLHTGIRYYNDQTDPTTCNDGTSSSSTGPGTCSHHGGVDHANFMIGDGLAVEAALGLEIRF